MALVRFKLDPKAAEVQRPAAPLAPPARPPLSAGPVARPPPSPTPKRAALPAAPAGRRNVVVAAIAIVAVLVLAGGAAAIWFLLVETYPEKYLVKESEAPPGTRIASLSPSELDSLGMDENPGQIDREELEDRFSTSDGREPEEGWGEVLQSGNNRAAIFALRYADEDDARAAGRTLATICGFANGAVLRDGEIVVVVLPEGASRSNVLALVGVLRDKASDLDPVCGTA